MNAHLIALFTIFVWGTTFVSTKVLLVDFSPLEILFVRFLMGFAALWVVRPKRLKVGDRRHEVLFAMAGLTGVTLYYLLENIALVYADASQVGVIVAVSPLFTALIALVLRSEKRMGPAYFVGFAVAIAGVALVSFQGDAQAASAAASAGVGAGAFSDTVSGVAASAVASAGVPAVFGGLPASLFGNLLAVVAALVWAGYSTLVKRLADLGYETVASTRRTFGWGLLFMALCLPSGDISFDVTRFLDPVNVANLLFLGFIASATCFVTWGIAVACLGAARTTAYIYLVPVITVAASVVVLGEPLTTQTVLGGALTIGGLVLSQGISLPRRLRD